jgi:exopolysaccharide/PEP-CTERM locus tyrosine autokinase
VGKFTKALQKSKKEKKPIASKPAGTSPIPDQASKQSEQAVLKKKKLMAEQLKRKAMIKKKIMAEQARKSAALSKKIEKPASEKIDKVSDEFDLGAIHSALRDRQKKEAHPPPIKDKPIKNKIDQTSSLFEAPGMDLSEDEEKPDVLEQILTDVDEPKIPADSSQSGLTEKELSTIHDMFEVQTPPDESTVAEDRVPEKENEQPALDPSPQDTIKKQLEETLPEKDIHAQSKVIPISKIKSVEPAEKVAAAQDDRAVDKKYEPPIATPADFKPANIDSNLVALLRPDSFEAEQFRMLRSNLLFPLEGKPPRSILVTSAIPGEGKSFISSNLAVTFAQDIQTHVLLIDCDIRKPNIHKRFGYHHVTGLSEYLTGKMDISSILLNTNVPKLKILPGGRSPKNPSELLSSKRMSQLLEEVKEKYSDRYIIIDSPPPKLTAETNVLSRQVDGILLVAKYGKTRREDLTEVIDKFGKAKILGIVVNWFNLRASRYYGYGKYGGYKYYYGKPDE